MQEILPLVGIVVVLILVAILAFHVRKQRDEHVQLFVYMYGTILEGRLRNLVICLEDALDRADGTKSFADRDWTWFADTALCRELVGLAECNSLGIRDRKVLQRGCDCLCRAVVLMQKVSENSDDEVCRISPAVYWQWRELLTDAIRAFEAVRRNVVF